MVYAELDPNEHFCRARGFGRVLKLFGRFERFGYLTDRADFPTANTQKPTDPCFAHVLGH